jgi:hypothetical protein
MSGQAQNQQAPTRVECRAAKDPAVRRFIFAAILLGFGIYCLVDAYILKKYPKVDSSDVNAYLAYLLNHYGPFVFIPAGLALVVSAVVFLRRKLVADEEGIGYVGKERIPWTAVRSLDTARLRDKGILGLRYDAGGEEKTMVLDSWKLQSFRELVMLVEKEAPAAETQ